MSETSKAKRERLKQVPVRKLLASIKRDIRRELKVAKPDRKPKKT